MIADPNTGLVERARHGDQEAFTQLVEPYQTLAEFGAWYLILLGSLAVVVAMFLPKGIWGLVRSRLHLQVFPVGYWLHR